MIEAAALIVFPVLMAFAASSDLLTMTISNRISIALVAGFLAMALVVQMPWQAVAAQLACGVLILAITLVLFWRGWLGGGDAKLAAATAVWFGWAHVLDYGLLVSLVGAALTLAILFLRQWPLPLWLERREWASRLHDRRTGIPYGIALAAAGLLLYPQCQIWQRVIGG